MYMCACVCVCVCVRVRACVFARVWVCTEEIDRANRPTGYDVHLFTDYLQI
jgi:hypothetical protein